MVRIAANSSRSSGDTTESHRALIKQLD